MSGNNEYLGPNISSNKDNFFQTDNDLELVRRKAAKAAKVGKKGNPIAVGAKVLGMHLCLDSLKTAGAPKTALLGLSNYTAVRISLNPESESPAQVFKGHSGPVTCVAVQYNSKLEPQFLFTGSWDKTIKKWNMESGECVATWHGHSDFVKTIVVFRDKLYSGSSDGTVRKWDIATGDCLASLKEHTRSVEDIIIDETGEFFYTASSDTFIKKWDLTTDAVVGVLSGHLSSVYALKIVDNVMYSTSADKTLKRWNLDTLKPEISFEHPDFVKCVAAQNQYVFTGCRDEIVRVFDTNSGKLVLTFEGHLDEVSSLQLIYQAVLFSGSLDGTVRQWSLEPIEFKRALESFTCTKTRAEKTEEAENDFQGMTAEEAAELAELMD